MQCDSYSVRLIGEEWLWCRIVCQLKGHLSNCCWQRCMRTRAYVYMAVYASPRWIVINRQSHIVNRVINGHKKIYDFTTQTVFVCSIQPVFYSLVKATKFHGLSYLPVQTTFFLLLPVTNEIYYDHHSLSIGVIYTHILLHI